MKTWLNNNKIYFEIFSFIFLGTASIIVSLLTWKTSDKQLAILELEHRPIINVQREFKSPFELLIVKNVGYHCFETEVNIVSYYEVTNSSSSGKNEESKMIVISDYFDFTYDTENTIGTLATIYNREYSENEAKRINLEFVNHENRFNYYLRLESVLKVSTKDENKEKIDKYYLINSHSIIEISESDYSEIQTKTNKCYTSGKTKFHKQITINDLIE
nr:hypothetical protein [uncultured Draconibacterium sp.]